MVTNLTNLSTAQTFYDIVLFDNQVTGGMMGVLLITLIFLVLFILFMRTYDIVPSIMASSFLCFILSIMLVSIDLLNFIFIVAFGIGFAFGGFYLQFTRS